MTSHEPTPTGSDKRTDQPDAYAESVPDASLVAVVQEARTMLEKLQFPLETADAPHARKQAQRAARHINDYLLPRLENTNAPAVIVVGGSTGSGKSTLINSVLAQRVTQPGALRPTTRHPTLVHNPADKEWFTTPRILPSFAREYTHTHSIGAHERHSDELRLVSTDAMPQGIAFIDSPDVDSVVDENRARATQLFLAADLWLFVTTAARYADAVPWAALQEAVERDVHVAIVMNRVAPNDDDVVADFRSMLNSNGLKQSPLFVVYEQALDDGMVPHNEINHIAHWLADIATSQAMRDGAITSTRNGAIESLAHNLEELAVHAETQHQRQDELTEAVTAPYERAQEHIFDAMKDGSMLRGEVLTRWQDYVGTGEFMRSVEQKISHTRDKVAGFFRGRATAPRVQDAVGDILLAVIKDHNDTAASRAYTAWFHDSAGKKLLNGNQALATSSTGFTHAVEYQIREWQSGILHLVEEAGAPKRARARALAFGTNGLGAALMTVVFASTGGLTGAEIGIAGGTAVASQRFLEGIFGEDAVRRLAQQAQHDLHHRITVLLDQEQQRFLNLLDALHLDDTISQQTLTAAQHIQQHIPKKPELGLFSGTKNQPDQPFVGGVYVPIDSAETHHTHHEEHAPTLSQETSRQRWWQVLRRSDKGDKS
ncbi:dynamin family protein [Timonella sp. A28]|uniref:dynamin family protein n=1 Tax=Timonella sp. A28 TaxID=3442640 RepID=UPI003EB8F186